MEARGPTNPAGVGQPRQCTLGHTHPRDKAQQTPACPELSPYLLCEWRGSPDLEWCVCTPMHTTPTWEEASRVGEEWSRLNWHSFPGPEEDAFLAAPQTKGIGQRHSPRPSLKTWVSHFLALNNPSLPLIPPPFTMATPKTKQKRAEALGFV